MARSIWKGSLAFGLVNIPIELYSAVRDHRPKFRLLHAKDEEPVRYERVCQKEGKPVAWEDLVKGFEYAKGLRSLVSRLWSLVTATRDHQDQGPKDQRLETEMVAAEGLEPPRLAPRDPKSLASANFATPPFLDSSSSDPACVVRDMIPGGASLLHPTALRTARRRPRRTRAVLPSVPKRDWR